MTRLVSALAAAVLAALAFASSAQASFGLHDLDATFTEADGSPSPAMQAGSHPFAFTTAAAVNTESKGGKTVPVEEVKDAKAYLPPGFVGTPNPVPHCSAADFLAAGSGHPYSSCPDSTAVGFVRVEAVESGHFETYPVYNLQPAPGVAAKFGFVVEALVPVTIDAGVNPNPPYNLLATLSNVPQPLLGFSLNLTLWGVPADPVHNDQRGSCVGSKDGCSVDLPEVPFLTLPTRCEGPLVTAFEADSWQHPGAWTEPATATTHDNSDPPVQLGTSGCAKLGFAPHISSEPTGRSAGSGTGLDFHLDIEDEGLTSPSGNANSEIKKAVVTLPEGVTVNPSIAEGLATCSEKDLSRETVDSEPGQGCPQASKVGQVEVETPLLEGELLKGAVFVATQEENPFHTLIALYMVIKDPKLGILVKLPGKVEPDPKTGQLVTTFGEAPYELPQFPFSHFRFHFREGARAPLITPPACGTYQAEAQFTPWANPSAPYSTTASFTIDHGVGGGSCPPGGVPPFAPDFEAGSNNNNAGTFSPFYMRLTRRDGDQDMTKFSAILPPGETGSLVGISKCSDSAIATAKSKTGRQELASPSCSANAQIGRTLAGAGVGSSLTYVPGKIYLAGPYRGDPLSVVAITPAVAGPFDAGTVVVRVALTLNPTTTEVEVDGSASDPIPHILKGIVLKVRDLRVYADRHNFTLNPTSCDAFRTKATLFGSFLDVFNPADDVPVALSDRYQAANCANLGYQPALSFRLEGGTARGGHPSLMALFQARPGDANTEGLVVRLPHSAFLDQAHIRTICTRVQFAAKACPPAAQYGHVTVWTPLLEEPLEGPVYLRSSNHKLPDLVFDLHGLFNIELAARVDSAHGGIRTTLENLPDAPVSKVVLRMQGGQKGLIINSRSLCARPSRAAAQFTGQNGRRHDFNPLVRATSCKQKAQHRSRRAPAGAHH